MLVAALVLASFATHVTHLVFTQGMLYGIGAALLYNPFLIYVEERACVQYILGRNRFLRCRRSILDGMGSL